MTERETFEAILEKEPTDYFTRKVFADWLDEHDEPEEAERQRKYGDADLALRVFTAAAGLSYDDVIQAGYAFSNEGKVWYVETTDAVTLLQGQAEREAFWACWQIVTGHKLHPVQMTQIPFWYADAGLGFNPPSTEEEEEQDMQEWYDADGNYRCYC